MSPAASTPTDWPPRKRSPTHAAFLQQLEAMGDDESDALYAMVTSTRTFEEWDWRGAGPVECAIVRRDDDDVAAGATRPLSG
jgi:hypothetical protein